VTYVRRSWSSSHEKGTQAGLGGAGGGETVVLLERAPKHWAIATGKHERRIAAALRRAEKRGYAQAIADAIQTFRQRD
jgi:hypothetical protein